MSVKARASVLAGCALRSATACPRGKAAYPRGKARPQSRLLRSGLRRASAIPANVQRANLPTCPEGALGASYILLGVPGDKVPQCTRVAKFAEREARVE